MGGSNSSHSSTNQNVTDPEAARRMAAVAEDQQQLSEDQWQEYLTTFQPYDKALASSNQSLIQPNENLTRAQLTEQASLVPLQGDVQRAGLQSSLDATNMGLDRKFYETAMNGFDVNTAVNNAGADVSRGYETARGTLARNALANGINPNSTAFNRGMADLNFSRARDVGSAKSNARRDTKKLNLDILGGAMNMKQAQGTNTLNRQGDTQLGNYQLTNAGDRSVSLASNSIAANKAGMSPLTSSSSRASGWNFL